MCIRDRIYELLKSDPQKEWTLAEVTDYIAQLRPNTKYRTVKVNAANILSHLRREGYIRSDNYFTITKQTEIDLTEEQLQFFQELVDTLDAFQSLDPEILDKGTHLANSISQKDVAVLIEKAKDRSPNSRKIPRRQSQADILSIVHVNPGVSALEIQNILENMYGKKIGVDRINTLLKSLKDEGLISKEDGRSGRWEAKAKQEPH